MKRLLVLAFAFASSHSLASVVDLKCEMDEAEFTAMFVVDTEEEKVSTVDGGLFQNVTVGPAVVSFSNTYGTDSGWQRDLFVVDRGDLSIEVTMFTQDTPGRMEVFRRGLEDDPEPWGLREDAWEQIMTLSGACEIIEKERAF